MLKVKWMSKKKLNRLRGIGKHHPYLLITCGYQCSFIDCKHYRSCKYRHGFYHLHNLSVELRRWIYYKTKGKIDIHFPVYIQKLYTNLAGTTKCPHNIAREDSWDCWQCKYSDGNIDGNCMNEQYIEDNRTGNWKAHEDPEHHGRCKYFEVNEWYLNYDHKTGELIY